MDLKEKTPHSQVRHPWETTRSEALLSILAPLLREGMAVLDLGCGDGYVASRLAARLKDGRITAVDTGLTDRDIAQLGSPAGIAFASSMPPQERFHLILLLDVIEHVPDDGGFLGDLAAGQLADKGRILITAPAFQSLYSGHDAFLGHYRRYSLKQLVRLARSCDLRVERCGYLFSSLLLPKLFLFKILPTANSSAGVGNWRRGPFFTGVVEALLRADNFLLLAASRLGIRIPGLTGWVLCGKTGRCTGAVSPPDG